MVSGCIILFLVFTCTYELNMKYIKSFTCEKVENNPEKREQKLSMKSIYTLCALIKAMIKENAFFQDFSTMTLTHTRGDFKCHLLTSHTIDPSSLSFLFSLHCNVLAFGEGDNRTSKEPGNVMWGFGLSLQCLSWIWSHAPVEQLFPETPL